MPCLFRERASAVGPKEEESQPLIGASSKYAADTGTRIASGGSSRGGRGEEKGAEGGMDSSSGSSSGRTTLFQVREGGGG